MEWVIAAFIAGLLIGLFLVWLSDWHPAGVRAYMLGKISSDVSSLVKQHSDRVGLEVTEELCATEFALGDGSRVLWGDATVADHQQRIALLQVNAVANIETAARHEAAIRMLNALNRIALAIERSGVRRTGDAQRNALKMSRTINAALANKEE